jgi:hypothetical protein
MVVRVSSVEVRTCARVHLVTLERYAQRRRVLALLAQTEVPVRSVAALSPARVQLVTLE